LLPIKVDNDTHAQLFSLLEEEPDMELVVDLATQTLTLPDGRRVQFPIDGFSKSCLLNGVDEIGYVQNMEDRIADYEARAA
jgi:3-isopropylmalate/(R)-2-methylmalate dehydratase small subunit